jgi:hypothetical protein
MILVLLLPNDVMTKFFFFSFVYSFVVLGVGRNSTLGFNVFVKNSKIFEISSGFDRECVG